MSRKGQSRNNSGVADDDWDVTEADSLSDPLTDWDFGNLDVAETAPRRTGSGADRYSMEDQNAADNELAGEHSWESEFGSHPGPSNQGNGQRMNPRVTQPPMPQARNQQPTMASYQQFPPSSSAPPMMAYPGNDRNGRQTASQPIQGRPQVHSGAPMGQQPGMRPGYPAHGQAQQQTRPMYPTGTYTQPMHPHQQQRPMGQMPPQQRPMGQIPPQQQRPMGQMHPQQHMMPAQGQPRQNPQMGRGRSGTFLPQSEFNNGTYHRAQGY
uniref:Topoisomerase II-associated protein PAT1 n=1 Tax=Clandestinovirus TaxID=2831644 RepID=A0A8F8KPH5_9VIRU|nr:topoisomerase II-associated protein PAT1 [Clandestinovirus]